MTVNGRFAYSWTSSDRPARLDAALTAPEINIDRVHALAKAILGDTQFDRPREGALSLKIDRASVAGIEAKGADISMRLDANGLGIERLTIADFGGAMLAVKGRIDTRSQSPRGALTVDLEARALDGIIALVDKFSPPAAEQLRRSAQQVTPVRLRASVSVEFGCHRQRQCGRQIQGRRPRRRLQAGAAGRRRRRERCLHGRQSRRARRRQAQACRAHRRRRRRRAPGSDRTRPPGCCGQATRPAQSQCERPARRQSGGRWPIGRRPAQHVGERDGAAGERPESDCPARSQGRQRQYPFAAAGGGRETGRAVAHVADRAPRACRGHRLAHRRCRHGVGHQHRRAACGRAAAADAHRRRYRAGSNRAAGRDCRGDRDAGARARVRRSGPASRSSRVWGPA